MSAPILLDLSHTSHTRARTGIQRVARSLWRELGPAAAPVTYDPHQRTWRPLDPWELKNLATDSFSRKRGASWPVTAQLRGHTRRLLGHQALNAQLSPLAPNSGLLVPELFTPAVAAALPALFAATTGPRVAVFHDAIALKFPELTPAKTVARFPSYLRELLAFDGIAANSEDSRATLLSYWDWLGIPPSSRPAVTVIPLGIDPVCHLMDDKPLGLTAEKSKSRIRKSEIPTLLSVGSLEGRKNHLALLDACESLWSTGENFELHLVGLAQAQTGRAALARVHALQASGRPLRHSGPVTEAALADAYTACAFTVYPSLIEGFGLPVLESLAYRKPCICSAHGALGEATRDGGCIALDRVDAPSIAHAISRLLSTPSALAALTEAARARRFRRWSDYARDLAAWLPTLDRRV
jgi:glycosyltransferase involved in cell wall biosynthesis